MKTLITLINKIAFVVICLIIGCICLFIVALWAGNVSAFQVPAQPANYVNDYAGMLTPAMRDDLNQQLRDFERKTSNQFIVVTVPTKVPLCACKD